MKIASNIFSLSCQAQLSRTSRALQTSLERLSSGRRINSAKDDVAGLSISIGLEARIRGVAQSIRNANDGMSVLAVSESAMAEMTNVLQSIRELAVQAASGTISSDQRSSIRNQVQGLISEYDRLVNETEFNGIKLLNGSVDAVNLQVGNERSSQFEFNFEDLRKENVFHKLVGTATFEAPVAYGSVANPSSMSLADLNGDGNMDLVSSFSTGFALDNGVHVLLGNGDGTFTSVGCFIAAVKPVSDIEIEDLNYDGIPDIVTASSADNAFYILFGNGDGTFRPKVSHSVTALGDLELGDLNGDGITDIVTAFQHFLGNGDGTFKAGVTYGDISGLLKLGDMNNDGTLDVIKAVPGENKVSIYLGNGDGTFKPRVSYASGSMCAALSVADLNGDGKLDVVSGSSPTSTVNVHLGTGDGTLGSAVQFNTGVGLSQTKLADINGDGRVDVVASVGSSGLDVLLGNGDGTFRAKVNTPGFSNKFVLADFDGDGVLDVASGNPDTDTITVCLANSQQVTAISDMDFSSQSKVSGALSIIDGALAELSASRSNVGSLQNRLEFALDYLSNSREHLSRAYGTIIDADIAQETAELVYHQILQQAGISVMAQANVIQARVLDLLRY